MFQDILEQYPSTSSAKVSSFLLGNSLMESENYEEAIKAYTAFLQEYAQDRILVGLVQQRLGLAQLQTGDQAAAMSAFDAVLSNTQALNKDQVLFEMAKLAESDEKTDAAVKHYKQLIQEFPLSPLSTEASLRVKVLAPEETPKTEESETNTAGEINSETSEGPIEESEKLQGAGEQE